MWWQNIYSNIHYIDLLQSPFLPVLGELLVTLWKQGLLGLPAVSKEERWQHHKVSLSCLLGSPILLSGSCSVLASHSGLCVPSTRWMLADGKTILPFNYLKRGMQINLWHSMTECHLCGPRSIFDALSLISFLIRLCILLWCAVFTCALFFLWLSTKAIAHSLLCTGTALRTVSTYEPKRQPTTYKQ